MAVKKIELEEVAALTKELFHAHYAGDLEQWFSYLCPDSVYLGTGEPLLFGGDAIRLFWESHQHHTGRIFPAFFERQCSAGVRTDFLGKFGEVFSYYQPFHNQLPYHRRGIKNGTPAQYL